MFKPCDNFQQDAEYHDPKKPDEIYICRNTSWNEAVFNRKGKGEFLVYSVEKALELAFLKSLVVYQPKIEGWVCQARQKGSKGKFDGYGFDETKEGAKIDLARRSMGFFYEKPPSERERWAKQLEFRYVRVTETKDAPEYGC